MIGYQLKKWWPAGMLAAISLQPAVAQESEKAFSGKPVLTLFSNYKAGLGHKNENSGFNLDRAFVVQSAEHNVPELKTNCEFEHFLTQNKMRIWVIY